MDHLKKAIIEQISLMSSHKDVDTDLNFGFLRNHALLIVQLSEAAMTGPMRNDKVFYGTDSCA